MPSLSNRSLSLICLALGAAAACGFAPLGLWPLTLACFAAWMAIVHEAPTVRTALWRGWAFGVGHFTINDNWFQHAFDFQDKMPPALGYAAPLALALYLAVYPAAAAGLAWRYGRRDMRDGGYVLIFAAAWIVAEWLRATTFTGYAWDPLGVIWVPVINAARIAAYIGTYALSGLTIVAAGVLALYARRNWRFAIELTIAAVIAVVASIDIHVPIPAERTTPRLRIVQPNVAQNERGEDDATLLMTKLAALSGRPGPAPRLLLWPEGVVRDSLESGYPAYAYAGTSPLFTRWQIARLLGPDDIALVGGTTLRFDANQDVVAATNAVFAIDPRARIVGRYDKAHLVPYGEYLPMPWLLKPLGLSRLVPGDIDFLSGPGPRTLTLPGFGAIGMQICYEIIFSGEVVDPAHRPRLIFNPSNDAWFGKWGPPQHLAQARMRAIEEGLPIVRATPTGISAVIAADGRLIASIPHEHAGAIEVPIPRPLPPTLFARIGNWMAVIVVAALLLAAIALRRRRR